MWAAQGGVSKRSSRPRRATWGWTSTRPAPGRAGITTWLCVCWAAFLLSLQQAWGEGVDLRFAAMSASTFGPGPNAGEPLLGGPGAADAHPIPDDGSGVRGGAGRGGDGDQRLAAARDNLGSGGRVRRGGSAPADTVGMRDYYGRQNLGTIRGLTMSVQVGGQALGPVIAGFMFDYFESYQIPFTFFAVAVFMAGIMALAAKPPQAPTPAPPSEPAGVSG